MEDRHYIRLGKIVFSSMRPEQKTFTLNGKKIQTDKPEEMQRAVQKLLEEIEVREREIEKLSHCETCTCEKPEALNL